MAHITQMPSAGDVLGGRLRLRHELGRGSMSKVFEATAEGADGADAPLAVKILRPSITFEHNGIARFEREAKLASLLTHPNSLVVHDYGVHHDDGAKRGLPFIVMERLDGIDLQEYLTVRGAIPLDEATGILRGALGSLQEAHERGIIHRDLKPGNIFLCRGEDGESRVKVLDYGMAKVISGAVQIGDNKRLTAAGMICGTPQCMAPEQAMGAEELTPAVDVYALGCLAFQMLVGRPPYPGVNKIAVAQQHVHAPIPELPEAYANTAIGAFVRRALAKAPEDRFPDATSMVEALEAAIRGDALDAHLPEPPDPITAAARRGPYAEGDTSGASGTEDTPPVIAGGSDTGLFVALGVVVVVLVGLLFWWMAP